MVHFLSLCHLITPTVVIINHHKRYQQEKEVNVVRILKVEHIIFYLVLMFCLELEEWKQKYKELEKQSSGNKQQIISKHKEESIDVRGEQIKLQERLEVKFNP